MNTKIGINADQVSIKGGMMQFGKRYAVVDDWLAKLLVGITRDMGGIQQDWLRQS